VPPIRYDDSLPVHARRAEIAAAIAASPVVIVSGATGSGKSTQLPKICLELGRGLDGMIGHTQPRRLAAHALASRLATELDTALGDLVGYQVRFVDRTGPRTLVKLMTDGVLLRELERDPTLARYDTLILDEAHERNLNVDFLLGICRRLLPRRPDLKVVITSATIETRRFAEYFGGAPVIDVEGRSFPVEVRYRPLDPEDESAAPLAVAVARTAVELADHADGINGDTLVFLPGERQIQESLELVHRDGPSGRELLPLYSRLSSQEQERIFAPHERPRIILATNVAETSLTVPGVRFVIDSGLARISRYSPRAKLQRLPIEPVSRASAEQRKGRCGREGAGICIRLYSEEDFAARAEYTEPEIRRTNLASLILQMAALQLGAPDEFPFLDPPEGRLLNDGYRLLAELSAVDGERRITRIGRRMARLPVDPRLARILVESARLGCLRECLVIAAFLSIQDPRDRPAGRLEAADERHAAFADARSDFVTVLNLWREIGAQSAAGGSRALRRWCRDNFLAWPRIREWQDLHQQLAAIARSPGARSKAAAGSQAALHRALLAGFLGGIGVRDAERGYLGARDTRFVIAPGTPLARRGPQWVMAASLVDTGRIYARMVAQVQPSWIEAAAGHLVRRSYGDAEWSAQRGMVLARETVTLYGRVLHAGRLVDFSRIDPVTARRIFVEEALVRDRGGPTGAFCERNAAAVAAILALEAKLRRRDLLVGESAIAEFFLERIPSQIADLRSFRRWWHEAEARDPRLLDLPPERLLARPLPNYAPEDFPDELRIEGNALALEYVFDPTAEDDGVTLVLPLVLLPLVRWHELEWLVPGMLREKVIAILRGLPKELRRALVPIPDAADRLLAARGAAADRSLPGAVAAFATAAAGAPVTAQTVAAVKLPPWLTMNIRVVDGSGRTVTRGRDLGELKRALGTAAAPLAVAPGDGWQRSGVRRWDFGDMPTEILVLRDGVRLRMYPTVEDRGDSVSLGLELRAATAEVCTRRGLTRLAALALPQQHALVRRNAAADRELTLWLAAAGLGREVYDELADRAVATAVLGEEPLPREAAAFVARLEAGRAGIVAAGEEGIRVVRTTAQALAQARTALAAVPAPVGAATGRAIEAGLVQLTRPGWVRDTPEAWFRQLPKYAQAVLRRIARLREDSARDRRLAAQLEPWERALCELESGSPEAGSDPRVAELRWGIEEFRLSLYAQELRTRGPISAQRLDALLRTARRSVGGG
jgi:ATP-dependent helicase HrpA